MKCLKVGMLKEGKAPRQSPRALGWEWRRGCTRNSIDAIPRTSWGRSKYPESDGGMLLLYTCTSWSPEAHGLTSAGRAGRDMSHGGLSAPGTFGQLWGFHPYNYQKAEDGGHQEATLIVFLRFFSLLGS